MLLPSHARAEIKVVATIPPLHSLAASVLEGVTRPTLLIKGARSPHDFTLRPSDVEMLERADLVLAVDASFETGISRVVSRLSGRVPVLFMMQIDGVKLLRVRGSALRSIENIDAGEHQGHGHLDHHAEGRGNELATARGMEHFDPHLWLDLGNAVVFVRDLAKKIGALKGVEPQTIERINQNAEKLVARLNMLDLELKAQLAPFRKKPFLTYHDAYHYFERRYGVNSLGAVTSGAHSQPGVRHLAEVRALLKSGGALCLFTEPQFPPKLAHRLIDGTAVQLAVLDPLGAAIAPGSGQYFTLMKALGDNLASCLAAK